MAFFRSLVVIGFVTASVSVAAHHSFALFEMDKNVEFEGVISEWKWQNPHVRFIVDIAKAPGVDVQTVGRLEGQGGSINVMATAGLTRTSFKIGDPVRVVGYPMKDGSKVVTLFSAIRPDGTRLYYYFARRKDDVKKTSG